jgi:hypothetical protein
MPRSASGSQNSLPSSVITPDDGSTSPPMMCNSVDFPQPEGPTIETNSPW